MDPIRITKWLSHQGLCSRREAEEWIVKGWVFIDGAPAILGQKIGPENKITLSPKTHKESESKITILLNKPIGYVSAQPEEGEIPAIRLIKTRNQESALSPTKSLQPSHLKGLAVTGRLDKDSRGLLVFTQDGRIAKKLIGPHSEIEKEYHVQIKEMVTEKMITQLTHGMWLDGQPLKPALISRRPGGLTFILKEGRKRQIRRMCSSLGLTITDLLRVRIGSLQLGSLPEGQWRFLNPTENF